MEKPNPALFLKVIDVYLQRLTVKKIIPIDFNTAKNEVFYDMVESVPDGQEDIFRKALINFELATDLEGWYNE